jgi:uncharacterized protein YlxW (UPF0749 family)
MKERHTFAMREGERAMRPTDRWEQPFAIIVICFTLGFLIAVQVRALNSSPIAPTHRVSVLIDRLASAQEEIRHLRQEVDRLRAQLSGYEKAMAEGKTATERLMGELHRLRVLAGLTKVRGPGIIVRVADAPNPPPGLPSEGIVHDSDLLMLVNELRNAGAEAVAINDQRVVATTAIRCVGTLITVNGVTVSPPYEIVAIGDPDKLTKALTMPGGIVDGLKQMGIVVQVTRYPEVIIPSLGATPPLRFARPTE